MKKILIFIIALSFNFEAISQKNSTSFNYGTRNYASNLNSFKYGVLGSNQDAIGSPTSLVAAIVRLVPSAKKISDRFGNENISLRGRNSIEFGDEIIWDIDGQIFQSPPTISINQIKYVEILKGLSATNKYGSEGGAGVIVIKTSVNVDDKYLINSTKNLWKRAYIKN